MEGGGVIFLSAEDSQEAQDAFVKAFVGAESPKLVTTLHNFTSSEQNYQIRCNKVLLTIGSKNSAAAAAAAAKILTVLQPNGLLVIATSGDNAAECISAIGKSCLYVGFTRVAIPVLPQEFVKYCELGKILLGVWRRPSWAVGASESVNTGHVADALIDEDSLIDSNEKYNPIGKGRADCSSRPRACANCTCGRKESEEAAEKLAFKKQLEIGAVRSSCGNCYLGDAFRCEGCPYKGLPAFRPGEKVELSNDAQIAVANSATAYRGDGVTTAVSTIERTRKITLASTDD